MQRMPVRYANNGSIRVICDGNVDIESRAIFNRCAAPVPAMLTCSYVHADKLEYSSVLDVKIQM